MEKILSPILKISVAAAALVTLAALCPEAYASEVSPASAAAVSSSPASSAKKTVTVQFDTKLHCANCVKKVEENIAYLKGVKDLQVSLEKQEITVTFDPAKTSAETIAAEIRRLGYPANLKK